MSARTHFIILLLLLSVAGLSSAQSLEEMKARAEAAGGTKQIELYADLARKALEVADQEYTSGNVAQGQAHFFDSATYAEKASEEARQSGKRLKQTEISLRKLAEKMQEIKRSLSVEDRSPIEPAIQRVEQARNKLLERMFGKEAR
ncbi:MAG TPA: hypothetical protein VEG30_12655 [Terriglobales bacterium]|nr:hypothetical protein [Terriglobales bacterium]